MLHIFNVSLSFLGIVLNLSGVYYDLLDNFRECSFKIIMIMSVMILSVMTTSIMITGIMIMSVIIMNVFDALIGFWTYFTKIYKINIK